MSLNPRETSIIKIVDVSSGAADTLLMLIYIIKCNIAKYGKTVALWSYKNLYLSLKTENCIVNLFVN